MDLFNEKEILELCLSLSNDKHFIEQVNKMTTKQRIEMLKLNGFEMKKMPTIPELEKKGLELMGFTVDYNGDFSFEEFTGELVIYEYNGMELEVITWNEKSKRKGKSLGVQDEKKKTIFVEHNEEK